MQRKNLLLATTAVAMLAGAQQTQADGLYVSLFGGGNFLEDHSQSGGEGFTFAAESFDPDTGFAIGGAIGGSLENWVRGLRLELEVAFRRNDIGGQWSEDTFFIGSSGPIAANMSTFSIMSNVAYDIDVGMKVKPYVIAGAGWARSNFDGVLHTTGGNVNDTFNQDNSGFAWQLGAGFNYPVAPGVEVGVGYRYFDGPDHSIFAGKNNVSQGRFENTDHSVMLNLTIETN